jgi:hypothetical protein
MRLSGWVWLISGLILAVMSACIYFFVPRNGSPNNSMILFFFIGLIFILTGIVKVFFKERYDEKSVVDSMVPEAKVAEPIIQQKPNRVEQAVNNITQRQTQPNIPRTAQQHTNTYSHVHQYSGPIHAAQSAPKASHIPVNINPQHPAHHESEHGIRCRQCGNVNAAHAVYCHQCGNRLR